MKALIEKILTDKAARSYGAQQQIAADAISQLSIPWWSRAEERKQQ
jgi:hypothetical protein